MHTKHTQRDQSLRVLVKSTASERNAEMMNARFDTRELRPFVRQHIQVLKSRLRALILDKILIEFFLFFTFKLFF